MDLDRVLVIAPHPDDDILGVGGFLKKLSNSGSEILVLTVSGHLPPLYKKEDFNITLKEAKRAHELVGVSDSEYWKIPATKIGDIPIDKFNRRFNKVGEAGNTSIL